MKEGRKEGRKEERKEQRGRKEKKRKIGDVCKKGKENRCKRKVEGMNGWKVVDIRERKDVE